MKEIRATVASRTMALADENMKTSDMSTDKKGIKRKNWRVRLGLFMKIKSFHSNSKQQRNRSYRPTVEDMNQWAQSLDKLLSHKYGKAAFYVFLKSEFSEENIEFWTACEDFCTITSRRELVSKASSIYEEFIRNESPKEINLDFHTRNTIAQSLSKPSATSFLAAQKKVYSLMETNSYPRFISSDLYKELWSAAQERKSKQARS